VPDPDRQRGDLGLPQACALEEPGQVAFADPGQVRLVVGRRVELAHGAPELAQRAAAARVIPHAGRHDSAGPGDPAHLPQPRGRVGHEVDDELRDRGVERAVRERQPLGRGQPDVHPG
jgi:hypothetical protein